MFVSKGKTLITLPPTARAADMLSEVYIVLPMQTHAWDMRTVAALNENNGQRLKPGTAMRVQKDRLKTHPPVYVTATPRVLVMEYRST